MKKIVSILYCISFCFLSPMQAQTPFDSFAPETSRQILDERAIAAEQEAERAKRESQMDTIVCAAVIDMENQVLLLVDVCDNTIIGAAPLTEEVKKWLSVDPLVDKNISTSPYMYCNGNPIIFVDPDGRKVVYNDETGNCESMVNDYCSQSEMFNAVYKQLVESDNIYTFQFGETTKNVDGQFVPSKNGGVITLNRESAWSSAIPEETFHALQYDNRGEYNGSQLNLEFEAKVFVIMSGLPTGSYYGMDEDYRTSLLKMDIKEFTQPQSISEYIKQANIYSGYNMDNTIGGPSYWTPTTISPFNLISIIKRQK
ncbi:MAG: hypothetical protein IKN59_07200 [Paludibacteraceae bacterium]|nr:hypothetical protein [Paludibacteraceae bacterium]